MKNKETVLLVAIVVIAGGIYWWMQNNQRLVIDSPDKVLAAVQKDIKTSAPITLFEYMPDWKNETGRYIPLQGSSFSLGTEKNEYMGKYGSMTVENLDRAVIDELAQSIGQSFQKQGFTSNAANSANDSSAFINVMAGYERDTLKCLATFSYGIDPFADVFCGHYNEEQDRWRQELIPVINPDNDPDAIVNVRRIIDDAAIGDVHSRQGGGYYWLATKRNDTWQEVFQGQDLVPCSIVDQHQLPREIYEDCYDEHTQQPRFAPPFPS